jgi:hypothetical protein
MNTKRLSVHVPSALLFLTLLNLSLIFADLCVPAPTMASAEPKDKTEKSAAPEVQRKTEEIVSLLQKAIDTRDAALMESLIDFERVSSSFFQDALPIINTAAAEGKIRLEMPFSALLSALNSDKAARKTAEQFLGVEAKKFVLYGVQSGYFAGKPLPDGEIRRLDGGLFLPFAGKTLSRKKLEPGLLAYEDGKLAMVRTALHDGSDGRGMDLDLSMQKRGSAWVITGVANDDEILGSLLGNAGK